jgi:ACS family tartrate transporter-like MFS transporter
MLTAFSLVSAMVFHSLFAIIVILCLAVIGIYAGKGPVWALSTDWLSAGTAAAGLAQINAISNLAGFGTTFVVGYIKQISGNYSLALLPLAALSGIAAISVLILSRERPSSALAEMNPAAIRK